MKKALNFSQGSQQNFSWLGLVAELRTVHIYITPPCYCYIFPTATSTPQLKDLHNHITPHYAARWRVIGALLGLSSGTLDIIKYDNDKARPCCDAMLEEWLEVDPSATWNKLLSVIQSPAVSSDQTTEKGDYISIFQTSYYFLLLSCRC